MNGFWKGLCALFATIWKKPLLGELPTLEPVGKAWQRLREEVKDATSHDEVTSSEYTTQLSQFEHLPLEIRRMIYQHLGFSIHSATVPHNASQSQLQTSNSNYRATYFLHFPTRTSKGVELYHEGETHWTPRRIHGGGLLLANKRISAEVHELVYSETMMIIGPDPEIGGWKTFALYEHLTHVTLDFRWSLVPLDYKRGSVAFVCGHCPRLRELCLKMIPSEFDSTRRTAHDAYVWWLLEDVLPIVLHGRRGLRWFRIESEHRDRDRSGKWIWDLDAFKGRSANEVKDIIWDDFALATGGNE